MTVYKRGTQERCPCCLTVVKFDFANHDLNLKFDKDKELILVFARCPQCDHVIITVEVGKFVSQDTSRQFVAESEIEGVFCVVSYLMTQATRAAADGQAL